MGMVNFVEMSKQGQRQLHQQQQQRDRQLVIVGKARHQRNSSSKLCSRQQQVMKSVKSQKIRDSEPRRTLIRSSCPDVQWRRLSKEDRLRDRGFHHKVCTLLALLDLSGVVG
jgi:uncharacterized protein YeaC (DUF1315 family)